MITSILNSANQKLSVIVKSRKKTYFEGEVLAVSSTNEKGPFDILPHHANFITMVKDYVKITLPDATIQEIAIKAGVMQVYENKVSLYLTIA